MKSRCGFLCGKPAARTSPEFEDSKRSDVYAHDAKDVEQSARTSEMFLALSVENAED